MRAWWVWCLEWEKLVSSATASGVMRNLENRAPRPGRVRAWWVWSSEQVRGLVWRSLARPQGPQAGQSEIMLGVVLGVGETGVMRTASGVMRNLENRVKTEKNGVVWRTRVRGGRSPPVTRPRCLEIG